MYYKNIIWTLSCVEDYYFYHWQYLEAFIYFSHHFVTLPPPTWTNVAHRHGVLSMGTIITEWDAGAKLCHRFVMEHFTVYTCMYNFTDYISHTCTYSLLSDESKVVQFAQRLVDMAEYYNFDGWLVNIENPIHVRYNIMILWWWFQSHAVYKWKS